MKVTEIERKESTKHCYSNGCLRSDSAEHEEEAEALIDGRIAKNNTANADRQVSLSWHKQKRNRAYRSGTHGSVGGRVVFQ